MIAPCDRMRSSPTTVLLLRESPLETMSYSSAPSQRPEANTVSEIGEVPAEIAGSSYLEYNWI